MPALTGKVAAITGAARGQGRSHAVRLAEEGADIIAVDICKPVDTAPYPTASPADLEETVRQVEALGRRIVAHEVDVRDRAGLRDAIDSGVRDLGRLDILLPNAGIVSYGRVEDISDDMWDEMVDINLSGVFRAVRAAIPHLRAHGDGGSIVFTSSTAGTIGIRHAGHYTAAKHGVIGLMKTLANELGPDLIRVNAILPGSVNTDMIHNEPTYGLHRPDMDAAAITTDDVRESFAHHNPMPLPWIEAIDISNAIVWLVSDAGRYVTGVQLPIDLGRAAHS